MDAFISGGHYNDYKFYSDNFVTLLEWVLNSRDSAQFFVCSTNTPYKVYWCQLIFDKDTSTGFYKYGPYSLEVNLTIHDYSEDKVKQTTLFVNSDDYTLEDTIDTFNINFLKNNHIDGYFKPND